METAVGLELPSRWEGFEPWRSDARGETLVVILHGLGMSRGQFRLPEGSTRDSMLDVIAIAKDAYSTGGADIYAPTLPYSKWRDGTGANAIVEKIVEDLDFLWESRGDSYARIIFVGHSMGGILLRRVFLYGARRSPDFAEANADRDDLGGTPRAWADKVERLVLIATWDKGWSVSDRDSWWAAIGLNLLGFWSRSMEFLGDLVGSAALSETGSPSSLAGVIKKGASVGRTMFDMRRGSPFIVQTRLRWMAYRRWFDEKSIEQYNEIHAESGRRIEKPPSDAVNPLVIQLIGTTDDFVSPLDQVDNDVNYHRLSDDEERNFFLLEMRETDHRDAIKFGGAANGERRRTFIAALVGDRSNTTNFIGANGAEAVPPLEKIAKNPLFFEDRQTEPDLKTRDVVFIIHGIRDNGYWTHRIAKVIKEADEKRRAASGTDQSPLVTCTPTYGYFPMGEFLLPWIRQQKTEWFMDLYVNVKARYPNARLHYVGHSNGTYLAAKALTKFAAARFANIYFAGSVVNPKFEWKRHLERGAVERFHNVRGATDWVVALLPKSVDYFSDLGGGGFDGFLDLDDPRLTQSKQFALGGHSGAILEPHWEGIGDFIVNDKAPIESHELFVKEPYKFLRTISELRVGIPAALLFALVLVLSPASIALAVQCLTEFFVTILTFPFELLLAPFAWLARTFPPSWHWLSYFFLALAAVLATGVLGRFVKWLDSRFSFDVRPIHVLAVGFAVTIITLLPLIAHEANLIWDGSKAFAAGSALSLAGTLAFVAFVLTRF